MNFFERLYRIRFGGRCKESFWFSFEEIKEIYPTLTWIKYYKWGDVSYSPRGSHNNINRYIELHFSDRKMITICNYDVLKSEYKTHISRWDFSEKVNDPNKQKKKERLNKIKILKF